jgi:hypothetical protein
MIQAGYTQDNPFEGVYLGRNSVMTNAGGLPIRTRRGQVLLPVCVFPLDENGEIYNPGGGFTWSEGAVLIGEWGEDGRHIRWQMSQRLQLSPEKSTRGVDESTIAEMPDGRLLLAIRGSNDVNRDLPGRKWRSISEDGGYTWSDIEPWTYDDGEAFFSPASCSQFLRHSNGTLYWFGNICDENPEGNHPRYPLVGAEVDTESLTLKRDTVVTLLTRRDHQHRRVQYSNFLAREDRQTGRVAIHLSPIEPLGPNETEWTGDAMLYQVEV